MKKNKRIVVTVSGYFDPLHIGHLEYLEKAKQLGTYLVVILNNNHQARLKKGKEFMDELERKKILESVIYVDEVFISIDKDRTVCESLRAVKPQIFANGGDRNNQEIPESAVCREYGIELVDGLGTKIQSSSNLIGSARYLEIGNRPWGSYFVLEQREGYKVKRLLIHPKGRLSLQSHKKREEHWVVTNGTAKITLDDKKLELKKGESITIPKQSKHRIENEGDSLLEIIEVQIGEYLGEDDITRYEDFYGRVK